MLRLLLLGLSITLAPAAIADNSAAEQLFHFHYAAAKRDNPESMYILASMYEGGRGTEVDIDEAIKWYGQAARFGITRAAVKLQEMEAKKRAAADREKQSQSTEVPATRSALQQELQAAQKLKQQLGAEKDAVEQAKADAQRAALLLQQQIDAVMEETQNARIEAENVRQQQEQLAREKAELESLRQHIVQQQEQQSQEQLRATPPQRENQSSPASPSRDNTFKADPCDGPSARFMSTCR